MKEFFSEYRIKKETKEELMKKFNIEFFDLKEGEKNMMYKGQIQIEDKLVVSDPYYNINTWCIAVLEKVLPGKYNCYMDYIGNRVRKILIIHEGYNVDEKTINVEEPVDIGVDSAQAGFYNYNYFKKYSELREINESEWEKEYREPIRKSTFHEKKFDGTVINGMAFVSSSGYGDGSYECYTKKNEDGKIIAAKVIFIVEEEDNKE